MSLITVLLVCIIAGVGLYLLNLPQVPIDGTVKRVINAVVLLVLIVWVILFLARLAGLPTTGLGRL